jgi:molybdopterin converting factor small subunit
MAVIARVPPYWRKHTDRQADVLVEGSTVGEVLEDLARRFPELRERLFPAPGELAGNLSVFLNQESVVRRGGLQTPVSAGDRVTVILAIAGG